MARSDAETVQQYLAELPADRRAVIAAVREVILSNLPRGYVEGVNWGMIVYEVPLERYTDTYNGHPLGYVALAAQKHHFALYMMCAYQDSAQERFLQEGFRRAGKKLDMGKSCIRFRRLEDIPLDVIGKSVRGVPVDDFIAQYEASRRKK